VYDPILGTVSLQLSVRSDGFANSFATYLGDDGVVLGYYEIFDGMTLLGQRALYWSREDGLHDLGQLVVGGLNANGWAELHKAIQTNGLGQILGFGITPGLPFGSETAFLLTPLVPGDFDSDGDVDGADFVAWQTHFPLTTGATLADGDADGDGDVDGADFVVWQTNFPHTAGTAVTPVPEPQTLISAALALVVLVARTRRCATDGIRARVAAP
jgi:hypothetical protein